ncbi:MAG: SufE family protein [Verrucomicrobiota bacterium]
MTLQEKRDRLVEDLSVIEDDFERFGYIIDMGKTAQPLPDELKLDEFLIEGCTSQLWVVPSLNEGKCYFAADADSQITKGIAALPCDFYSGHSPEEVLEVDTGFLGEVGVTQHLSPNRRNGLSNLSKRIESFARSSVGSA